MKLIAKILFPCWYVPIIIIALLIWPFLEWLGDKLGNVDLEDNKKI